jgi:predicted NAD/FAD-dependent oxidoreductase
VVAKKMNYWKFARVKKPVVGGDCLVVSEEPPLAIIGDYFQGSGGGGGGGGGSVGSFGGCVRSASAAARAIINHLRPAATTALAAPTSRQIANRAAQPPRTTAVGRNASSVATAGISSDVKARRVLIVGGGISGALTAHLLKRGDPELELHVWEMARGAGGRMSTTRWGPAGAQDETKANTGAQYVSAAPEGPAAGLVLDAMEAGLLEGPLSAGQVARHSRCFSKGGGGGGEGGGKNSKDDFRATQGTSAVVKHFLDAADTVQFETRLQSLQLLQQQQQQQQRKKQSGGGGGGGRLVWVAVPNRRGKAKRGAFKAIYIYK